MSQPSSNEQPYIDASKRRFREKCRITGIHAIILMFALLTLIPFFFVINNSFRNTSEMQRQFFGIPNAFKSIAHGSWQLLTGNQDERRLIDKEGKEVFLKPKAAIGAAFESAVNGYVIAKKIIRPYMLNTILVCLSTAFGVLLFGSVTAYILARYRFSGSKFIFYIIISTMMFPGVLTLVPAYLIVKNLGLLDSHWVLILPYVAGGQVFAIFVFKSFFEGLPEDLFESARIDGAGHLNLYWNIVLPLSKPVLSVVLVMNIIGTWNNFLWPFIVNTNPRYHVIASGLYVMATSGEGANMGAMFSAYLISSLPLLVLFTYATKPFIQGVTSGAFKA